MADDSSPTKRAGYTRRGFLRGAGISAVAAVAEQRIAEAAQAVDAQTAADQVTAKVVGPGKVPVMLNVNGQARRLSLEPRTTLAEALRYDLDLTGAKIVCDRGACSACTVFLDGTPVNACMTLAIDAADRAITTVEGLARGDELHPVQAAFIEKDAMQCGFCTGGMIMSCVGLLNRNANPTPDEVRQAVRGNVCRCGTYPKVFEATLAAAETLRRTKGG